MNIVDIKKRVKEEFYIKRDIDFYEAQEDISYLLSIIEQNRKASTDLIYDNTVLQEKLNQAYQTIRAYEAMENLK